MQAQSQPCGIAPMQVEVDAGAQVPLTPPVAPDPAAPPAPPVLDPALPSEPASPPLPLSGGSPPEPPASAAPMPAPPDEDPPEDTGLVDDELQAAIAITESTSTIRIIRTVLPADVAAQRLALCQSGTKGERALISQAVKRVHP